MLAIKSIFAKEYSGRMCLASHDDTQLFPAFEDPKDKKPDQVDDAKVGAAPAPAVHKPQPAVAPKPPREVRTYRV